jgi:hypothetical protein
MRSDLRRRMIDQFDRHYQSRRQKRGLLQSALWMVTLRIANRKADPALLCIRCNSYIIETWRSVRIFLALRMGRLTELSETTFD